MRRLWTAFAALALAVVVTIGIVSADGSDDAADAGDPTRSRMVEPDALAGAPGPLGDLYSRDNELVDGGAVAFRDQLSKLEGHPVVVNKWASWCGPCRAEFPFFQGQALERGREIAFIGVNSADNDGDARRFLDQFPVPYPSFRDPDSEVAQVFRGVAAFPTTAFYDSKGKLAFLKQGGYATEAKLAEDIERYAR